MYVALAVRNHLITVVMLCGNLKTWETVSDVFPTPCLLQRPCWRQFITLPDCSLTFRLFTGQRHHNGDLHSLSNLVEISLPCCVLQLWQIAALMVMPYFRSRNAWCPMDTVQVHPYLIIFSYFAWDFVELSRWWRVGKKLDWLPANLLL